jgi:hypothetical protein
MANAYLEKKIAKVSFDPSGDSTVRGIASHNLKLALPDNAIITNAWYDVTTTFTSATDAATIALTVNSAGDLKAAIAISAAGDVYDAGIRGCLPGSYAERTVAGDTAVLDAASKAASYIKLTAVREVVATVAVEALTAGKLDLFIEYVVGE